MSYEGNRIVGDKSYTAALILSFFLGGFGIHRFYTGYIGIGILQLITAGGCGIWTLIDFISLCFGKYKDADGNELADYNPTLGQSLFWVWMLLLVLSVLFKIAVGSSVIGAIH